MTGGLGRLLRDALSRHGAILDGVGGGTPFDVLRAQAASIHGQLRAGGINPDEPVHVAIGNRAADLAALLGVWEAGGVAVPVHVSALPVTVARLSALSRARFAVDAGAVNELAEMAPPHRTLLKGAALVISTSGSTGLPKGVVIGHERLLGKLDVLDHLLCITPGDQVVMPLQLTFIFGMWVSLLTLRSGATLSLMPRLTADALPSHMKAGVTVLTMVPSMLRTLLSAGALIGKGPRLVLTGGEALGAHLRQAIRESWPETNLFDLYGLTETGSCDLCLSSASHTTADGSIGLPTEGVRFRIGGSEQGISGVGELQIYTPFGMLGYLDDPTLTTAAFSDEFFRTGDLARVRPDGFVELVGRSKEIVSRGGNKIAPQEIDHLLCSHPAVAGALSAGVPHPRLGEALYTIVVLKADVDLTITELRQWLSERLERFKLPDTLSLEASLPTGSTGKASRVLLREMAITRSKIGQRFPSEFLRPALEPKRPTRPPRHSVKARINKSVKIQGWVKVTSTKWRGRGLWLSLASPILRPSSPRRHERAFDQRIVSVSPAGDVPMGRQEARCCSGTPTSSAMKMGLVRRDITDGYIKRRRCITPPPKRSLPTRQIAMPGQAASRISSVR